MKFYRYSKESLAENFFKNNAASTSRVTVADCHGIGLGTRGETGQGLSLGSGQLMKILLH